MLHEKIQSDVAAPSASGGVKASSVSEVRLEEGDEDSYCKDMLREQLKDFAMEKPQYYAVAPGRAPGIYMSWAETEPLVSGFRGSRNESFWNREEAGKWLLREMNYAV